MLVESLLRLIRENKYQKAIDIFSRSSIEDPGYENSLLLILNILIEGKAHASRASQSEWYKQLDALALESNLLAVYTQALKSESEGELENTLSLLERCLEINSNFLPAKSKKATILLKQEKWKSAEALLRKLIKGHANETHLLNNLSISILKLNKLDILVTKKSPSMQINHKCSQM